MPKSRGRKPKKPARRTASSGTSWESALLKMGARLDGPRTTRLRAEALGSDVLGAAWSGREMGSRRDRIDLFLADVVELAERRQSRAAALLVAALRLLVDSPALDAVWAQPWAQEESTAITWAEAPAPVAVAAGRAVDPYRDMVVSFVDYGDHVLAVTTRRSMDELIDGVDLVDTALEDLRERIPETGDLAWEDAGLDEVLAFLAEAQHHTEMVWPPVDEESYVSLGFLLEARLRGVVRPEVDWEGMTDEEKSSLVEEFLASKPPGVRDDPATREVLDALLWFGDGYMRGGPLAWAPDLVDRFLFDWLPRKTFLDEEVRAAVAHVTAHWVTWGAERSGVPPKAVAELAEWASEIGQYFEEQYDGSERSPATEIARRIHEAGAVDQDDVDRIVSEYNAEQLARRLHDS